MVPAVWEVMGRRVVAALAAAMAVMVVTAETAAVAAVVEMVATAMLLVMEWH